MFGALEGAVDHALERRRGARRVRVRAICEQQARLARDLTQIVRDAEDEGDCVAAGCASSAQWLAQISSSEHRSAVVITRTSSALRALPALDAAMGAGVLNLDQVVAAVEFATPASDARLARLAVGKPPGAISLVARTLVPPVVEDDAVIYRRRGLRMAWASGRRELCITGRLALEDGLVFEGAIRRLAKAQRADDKRAGVTLDWQQSAADALVVLARGGGRDGGGVRRGETTLIVHVGEGAPPLLEGAGPIGVETAERLACDSRRLTIRRVGRDLVHSRVGRCASYAQLRALHRRSDHCQYPGCTAARELHAHHLLPDTQGGKTEVANMILLCGRHHRLLHDRHIRTTGTGERPVFTGEGGRVITAHQPHAPPG